MFELIQEVQRNLKEPLDIVTTSKFKKGLKKHQHDKRVSGPLKDLIHKYLKYNKEVPIEYNDHALSYNKKGYRSAHIKGQQVVLLYKIDDNILELSGLGSHTELNIM